MRIGVRAHDLGRLPAERLADRISKQGLACIQLTVHEAIEGYDDRGGRLSPGFAYGISDPFRRRGIQIAVLSCYINLIHPDDTERRSQIQVFKEHLRFVRDFGCAVVATETGSMNADWSFHPGNHGEEAFQLMLKGLEEMVAEAEKFGVIVAVEGVASFPVSTPERIRRMLDSIGSQNLQVLLDPVNLLTPDTRAESARIIEESFRLFGDRIVAVHAKDFRVESGRMVPVPLGDGLMDYALLLRHLKTRKPLMNVIIEDTSPATIGRSMKHLASTYASV